MSFHECVWSFIFVDEVLAESNRSVYDSVVDVFAFGNV